MSIASHTGASHTGPRELGQLQRFGAALDALRARVEADIGAEDLDHIRRVDALSRRMELAGRLLVALSVEPVGFVAGVTCLWIHKQLQAAEIGHTVLHGTFDRITDSDRFHSRTFRWRIPIDEASWCELHNLQHHSHTNVAGRDVDLTDLFAARPGVTRRDAIRRVVRKAAPYYAREYLLYPALAGPLFWKVALGNWMSELLRDVYSVVTIYSGHDGADVAYYPEGTRASSRAEWYRMQVEATSNFDVPLPISLLCGGLDRHIEHHLFPRLPPNRLREISPEVRRVCEQHGVPYKTDTWPRTLRKVWRHIRPRWSRGV